MVSVVHLLVPGRATPVAQVLATCEQKCTEMREAQPVCQHLHSRLVGIFDVLQRRCSVGSSLVGDVFTKFSTLVSEFIDFLEHYGEQSLVYRVIKQRTIVDKLQEINEKVGEVFNLVGMVTSLSWKEQFEQDTRVLNEVLEAMARDSTGVLRELKGFRAREEALLTLKFEVERREDEHGEELVLLMRKMIATIGGEEASTAALPGWFVPLYELEMETDPFARGTFGSVYRGLWKSGTAVVVKRVQIDSMEVDEGVQLKIVKELDKLHELIHPNLIKMFGASHLDCSFPESDFENLQEQVCNSTAQQYSHLAEDLRHDSLSTKLKAVISCACVAELRGSEVLQDAGVVAPLVALLTQTDEALTLWSMDAVGNVADNNEMRGAFAREGAIPPLLELLKTGTNDQTALAAYALGSLASGHDDNNVAIVGSGAIAGLIELLTGDTDMQRNFAAFALESLAEGDHEANWLTMANEGAIPALLGLLRTGTSIQKSHAVSTLGSLASSDENCVRIAREGIIPDLVSLFQQGTTNQKERAVGALFYLSRSVKNSKRFLNGGCIAPLLESIESGTEEQVEHAIYALGNLASHTTDNGKVIVENGAISPLKEVLRTGTEVQKGVAAFTLGLLSTVSETIRLTIGDEETMKLLVQLLLTTSGEQKDLVVSAVCYLTKHGNGDLQAIKSDAVVPHLVELLHRRAPKHQTFYATVLGRFASDEAFRTLIGIKGGIPPLVKLLRTGNASNKEKAAIALGRLAVGNPANKDEIVRLGAVTLLEKLRRTGTRQQKCTATTALADIEDDNEAQPRRTRRRVGA
ncbi:hypothetical protein PR002_g19337 [Phytophthora rubi]|uniref:Protein kinase domain-containing protein n=1 Tax=Phytophthora rubi TaxID=129364 RepID=A0A6A3JNQ8_9STRA|nr:hypothetical protein PR002_g19337 [Phytophthora rubi]